MAAEDRSEWDRVAKTKCSGEDEREAGDGAAWRSRQGNGGDERATRDGMAWQRQAGFGRPTSRRRGVTGSCSGNNCHCALPNHPSDSIRSPMQGQINSSIGQLDSNHSPSNGASHCQDVISI